MSIFDYMTVELSASSNNLKAVIKTLNGFTNEVNNTATAKIGHYCQVNPGPNPGPNPPLEAQDTSSNNTTTSDDTTSTSLKATPCFTGDVAVRVSVLDKQETVKLGNTRTDNLDGITKTINVALDNASGTLQVTVEVLGEKSYILPQPVYSESDSTQQ